MTRRPAQNFALIGAGFFAGFQAAAWRELPDARCVAVCDSDLQQAIALAAAFPDARPFTSLGEAVLALGEGAIDFVDVVTPPGTHRSVVEESLTMGFPTICQKPLAETIDDAEALHELSRKLGVSLVVHENWRWQRQIRAVAEELAHLGTPFRTRIVFSSSFPVFVKQPSLRSMKQFLLMDVGPHILDIARWLLGEPSTVYARTTQVNEGIAGEDVATVVLGYANGSTVVCEMGYASLTRHDRFPETFISIETDRGSVELVEDFEVFVTTSEGTRSSRFAPHVYPWSSAPWHAIQASIVACNANLLGGMRGELSAETSVDDNIRSLGLVFDCYRSAELGEVVSVGAAASAREVVAS